MGAPFSLTRRVKEQFEEVDLFSKLDADGDGAVSTAELTDGLHAQLDDFRRSTGSDTRPAPPELSPEVEERLRALGYVD